MNPVHDPDICSSDKPDHSFRGDMRGLNSDSRMTLRRTLRPDVSHHCKAPFFAIQRALYGILKAIETWTPYQAPSNSRVTICPIFISGGRHYLRVAGRPNGITVLGILWILSSLYELGGAEATSFEPDFFIYISLAIMFLAASVGILLAKHWAYPLGLLIYPVLFLVNTLNALTFAIFPQFVSDSSVYILTLTGVVTSAIFAYVVRRYFKGVKVREYFSRA